MPTDLTKEYMATLPSITKALFYSTLSLTLFLTALHSPLISYALPAPLLHTLRLYVGVPSLLFSPTAVTTWPFALHRLVAPFLLYPLLSPPTLLLSLASLITLLLYSRNIEEERLLHASGAAKYTSALAFALLFLLSTSTLSSLSSSKASPDDLPQAPPPSPYFASALSLLFFIVTLDTTFEPYEPLSFSSILQQWHSPYLLLVLFSVLSPAVFGSVVLGIVCAYVYHVVTVGAGRVWGVRLWGVPEWMVRLYERWGIGERKIGLQAREGGVQLGGQ